MKRMVLVGERPLKRGTVVHVELVLESGEKLLRAEGKVLGMTKARHDRPKGLEVRLKRYGGSTKRFLERAAEASSDEAPADADAPAQVELVSQVEVVDEEPVPSPDSGASPDSDRSGVRIRVIEAPPDREALLERLRERARRIAES